MDVFDDSLLVSDVLDDANKDARNGLEDGRFRWGIHGLVGHGKVGSEVCGHFRKLNGCLGRNGAHDKIDIYGNDFRGKAAVQNVFMRCYSARCPICYRKGWAKREADRGEARLLEASKRFGLVWFVWGKVLSQTQNFFLSCFLLL